MEPISRREPRRPYVITSAGIRRIVLRGGGNRGDTTNGDELAAPASTGTVPSKPRRTSEAPTSNLLVIVCSERGVLDEHARQVIVGASLIASSQTAVVVGVLGELNEDLADYGADIVITLPDCDSRQFQPEHVLARADQLLERYRPKHVFLPDRPLGEGDLGRRLAATHGASVATNVVELTAEHVASYRTVDPPTPGAGTAAKTVPLTRLALRTLPDIVLLAPDVVETRFPFVGRAERVEGPPLEQQPSIYVDGGLSVIDSADLPLEEADFIASAGNGVSDVALFQRLAKALGAATGASRVAVDDGRFARNKQIGATGKTVSANAYLAIGISGAVQHLQGIKDCRHVIAVNRDIAAPIIQRANLSLIDDAQEFMRALTEAVELARSGVMPGSGDGGSGNATAGSNASDGANSDGADPTPPSKTERAA